MKQEYAMLLVNKTIVFSLLMFIYKVTHKIFGMIYFVIGLYLIFKFSTSIHYVIEAKIVLSTLILIVCSCFGCLHIFINRHASSITAMVVIIYISLDVSKIIVDYFGGEYVFPNGESRILSVQEGLEYSLLSHILIYTILFVGLLIMLVYENKKCVAR